MPAGGERGGRNRNDGNDHDDFIHVFVFVRSEIHFTPFLDYILYNNHHSNNNNVHSKTTPIHRGTYVRVLHRTALFDVSS